MRESDPASNARIRPLEVAVDARNLVSDERGIGTYARALLSRYVARSDMRVTLLVHDWFPRRRLATLRRVLGDHGSGVRVAGHIPRRTNVVWHPWNGTWFTAPVPSVATIHDVVPFALPAADARRRASIQAPFLRVAALDCPVVCDSAFTVAEVRRYLGISADRVHCVYLGVDPAFSPGSVNALPERLRGRRYVLYVGAHDAHKNVSTLVAAHRAAYPHGEVDLVFTRPSPEASVALVYDRAALATLVALYRAALIVAVPSLYEGFGLPVLEALACGAPVLAARAASLPEVGGDAAAYVDDVSSVEAWRCALVGLTINQAQRAVLGAAGPRRASLFTWEACAEGTLNVLRSAARSGAAIQMS